MFKKVINLLQTEGPEINDSKLQLCPSLEWGHNHWISLIHPKISYLFTLAKALFLFPGLRCFLWSQDAICPTDSSVFKLVHCVNFKAMRYQSANFIGKQFSSQHRMTENRH